MNRPASSTAGLVAVSSGQHTLRSTSSPAPMKTGYLFLLIVALHLLTTVVYQQTVWTRSVYDSLFGNQIEESRLEDLFQMMKRFDLLGYILLPLLLILRVSVAALFLQGALLMCSIETPFSRLYRLMLIASLTGPALLLTKSVWFLVHPPTPITSLALAAMPLSLESLIPSDALAIHARVFFQGINLFEAAWVFIVWRGLTSEVGIDRQVAAGVVAALSMVVLLCQVLIAYVLNNGAL